MGNSKNLSIWKDFINCTMTMTTTTTTTSTAITNDHKRGGFFFGGDHSRVKQQLSIIYHLPTFSGSSKNTGLGIRGLGFLYRFCHKSLDDSVSSPIKLQ